LPKSYSPLGTQVVIPYPAIGTPAAELDTPALCLDLAKFQANVATAAALCQRHGVAWRPHAKCHKSPDIGRRLIEAGAIGLTCAKLGEAEVFAAAGISDLLIANLLVGERKVERLVAVRRIADPIICIDHLEQVEPISRAMHAAGLRVRAIIEVDIGLDRVGTAPGEATLALAQAIDQLPGIELVGIMGYEGHLLLVEDQAQKRTQIAAALALLAENAEMLKRHGLACPIVSCGGTGSLPFAVAQPGITEVQAGGLIFMDAFYRQKCQIESFEFALTLQVTVVSRPVPQRAVFDAGRKSIHGEFCTPLVVNRAGVTVGRLSAEHGQLEIAADAPPVAIGERLHLVPGYADLTTVLHNQFYVLEDGKLHDIWPLVARGRLE
jgi:D-serine deaminase-like pyridoxal phosphate-dependent protein